MKKQFSVRPDCAGAHSADADRLFRRFRSSIPEDSDHRSRAFGKGQRTTTSARSITAPSRTASTISMPSTTSPKIV